MNETNEIVEIARMSYGPCGIAHLSNGKTVFVEGAVTGDVAEIEIMQDKGSFARAVAISIVEPSPKRAQIENPENLPYSLAPWAPLLYEAQLSEKEDNLKSALKRNAHVSDDDIDCLVAPIIASSHELNYRNKLEFAVSKDHRGRLELGSHDKQGNFAVLAGNSLDIAVKPLRKAARSLCGALRYMLGTDHHGLFRVGVRGSERTGSIEVALWTTPGPFPRGFSAKVLKDAIGATSVVRLIAEEGKARHVKKLEVLDGSGFWSERLDVVGVDGADEKAMSIDMRASAPSFFQVNSRQAASLVSHVIKKIDSFEDLSEISIADLYSGVGTFSIPLALSGADVVAIELAGSSVRDFKANTLRNDVEIDIVCDDVARAFDNVGHPDVVIVDPPRLGLKKSVIANLSDIKPRHIVYISCDPQTLTRDIARFSNYDYHLEYIQPFDMFPQTYHVETLCVLSC